MGMDNAILLELIEWFDQTGQDIVQRIPERGSGEIKPGAQLIVRDSQAAVFYYHGKAYDAFGPGRHTLTTANIPILNKILSLPWGMKSPLRTEVYFVNTRIFPNLKWGTKEPVAFKDRELGLIRLRAHGIFNIRIVQPVLLINNLVGTQGAYSTAQIEDYLGRVIVSRFNDHLGGNLDSLLNLPGRYDELSGGLMKVLQEDLRHFGIALAGLYINSITPPDEVQKAIDDKSRLGVFGDLDSLLKMKAAMAVEKVAENQSQAGAGAGMGMGIMMPALFAGMLNHKEADPQTQACPECKSAVPHDSKFCPNCGHQILVFQQCFKCGKNVPPHAKFCSRCGTDLALKPQPKKCPKCGWDNLSNSVFCNNCGEKL